jgi:hypothetical protein
LKMLNNIVDINAIISDIWAVIDVVVVVQQCLIIVAVGIAVDDIVAVISG